jgi:dihydrofolate reductase
MRTLAITQNITLDGRIEMLDDWFDDQAQGEVDNDDMMAENRRQDEAADALLVGRQTFEDFRGYWRDLEGDTTGISDYLNGVAKYVVSGTLTEPDWPGTRFCAATSSPRSRGSRSSPARTSCAPGRSRWCRR